MSAVSTSSPHARRHDWTALRRIAAVLGLVALPLTLYAVMLHSFWERGELGIDFSQTLLPAAEELADGRSPYPAYGYPPLVAFALVPFTVLPSPELFYTAGLVVTLPASLWILGIRDWRCYGAAFLWGASFHAIQTGNVTIVLLLFSAVAWRARDSRLGAGVSSGLAIATKLICWPLVVWLAASRRGATAAIALLVACGVTAILWGSLGFSGLLDYPSSLDKLETAQAPSSYTLQVLLTDLGAPSAISRAAWILALLVVLAAVFLAARRGADQHAYSFAILAAVIGSPIVWLHSFVLLLAVVAVRRPRFSAVWILPSLLWFGSGSGNGETWQTLLVLGVALATFVACVLPGDVRLDRARRRLASSP